MKIRKPHEIRAPLLVVLGLGLLAVSAIALPLLSTPPPEAQAQSFSVAYMDPHTASGISPADVLGIGGSPLIACPMLGLLCGDPTSGGPADDIASLSFGWDFIPMDLPPVQFSVTPGTLGASGSAVNLEANCTPPEAQADVFESAMDETNVQDLDGDGKSCNPTNVGYGLILDEIPTSNNVDALAQDPCKFVDLDCDSRLDQPVFFTLAPGSPSLSYFGVTPADILISGIGFTPLVWANGVSDLYLDSSDTIDAICIWENGNGVYDPKDLLLFSLGSGSPTLTSKNFSPADLLVSGRQVAYEASVLGLDSGPNEDLDALTCSFAFERYFNHLYLPLITR